MGKKTDNKHRLRSLKKVYTALNGQVLEYEIVKFLPNHISVYNPREKDIVKKNWANSAFNRHYFATPQESAKDAIFDLKKYEARCQKEINQFKDILAEGGEIYKSPSIWSVRFRRWFGW